MLKVFNLTMIMIFLCTPLAAQEHYNIMDITVYDIQDKILGPVTEPVTLKGYVDRSDYHETRYISASTGSDIQGTGSQSSPWATIRYALDQINDARLSKRYAIKIAAGSYAEGEIDMKEFIHLYGGFDPENWSRDIEKNRTIIDGQKQSRLFICADHAKIDGFMLTNGLIRGKGGAVYCNGTSPVISNNVFLANGTLIPDPWEPEFIHEVANDGGAIAAINGASPIIYSNLFASNTTETGRGGAIAASNRAAPRIHYNVFLENQSGLDDPMRSSDGGAISSAAYSNADIFFNVVLNNIAHNRNDGGGIFTELWSSLHVAGNLIVGNVSSDDGGGIYLSGQVHHYITLPDPVIPKERYNSLFIGNVIAGNHLQRQGYHGALRFTNNTRAIFNNNLSYANVGGLDFNRSDLTARNNIILENVEIRESAHPARFYNTLITGYLNTESAEAELHETVVLSDTEGQGDYDLSAYVDSDEISMAVKEAVFDENKHQTVITLRNARLQNNEFRNRIIKIEDNWSVIHSNSTTSVIVWGDHSNSSDIIIQPTYRSKK